MAAGRMNSPTSRGCSFASFAIPSRPSRTGVRIRLCRQVRQAHLLRGGDDLGPGVVVDRDAVALARRASFAFRLAGNAHDIESFGGRALLEPVHEGERLRFEA